VPASFGRLVAIDVKPGAVGDSESGLNLADEGCGR
jgi:hypothetical protein